MFFSLYTGVGLPVYAPTTSLKLIALRKVRVEKALLSKGFNITTK